MSEIIAEKVTLLSLLSRDEVIRVPRYQRSYSWDKENISELWEDLLSYVFDESREHFIGALIFCDAPRGSDEISVFELVDGQQRLISISILLSVMKDLVSGDNIPLATIIENEYIRGGEYDGRPYFKLQLGEVDNAFFRNNIQLRNGALTKKGKRKSHKRIVTAYNFFVEAIAEAAQERGKETSKFVEELFRKIKQKVVAIRIKVSSEVEAYTIFETINARGVDLTVSDLLKNYVFSNAGGSIDHLQVEWQTMQDTILDRNLEISQFIRHFWISHYGEVREKDLYRIIKDNFSGNPQKLESFCGDLKDESEAYIRIFDYQDDDAAGLGLLWIRGLKMRQCYPLLLSAFSIDLPVSVFGRLLKVIVAVSLERSITDRNPNELESFYYRSAKQLRDGGVDAVPDLINELQKYRIDSSEFKKAFIESEFPVGLAKLILEAWENSQSANDKKIHKATLEHIMPQKAGAGWLIGPDEHEAHVNRVGNLALISGSKNSSMSNRAYEEKRAQLSESDIRTTRKIAETYEDWNSDCINDRGEKIYNFVKSLWLEE